MLASIGGWLLGHVFSFVSGDVLKKGIDLFNKYNGDANTTTRTALDDIVKVKAIEADVEKTKMTFPWFWIMAGLLVGPVIVSFWAIALYNILWWDHGVWPQGFQIAAWPGVYQEWATTAFNWVFAPALGVGAILKILGKK